VVLEWLPEAMDEGGATLFARDFARARGML
jgi:hypothetical protein